MPAATGSPGPPPASLPAAFKRILCAVDDGPASDVAARQAALLARPAAVLRFVSTVFDDGWGADPVEVQEAGAALERCAAIAQAAGIEAETELRPCGDRVEEILSIAEQHDLLVVGEPPTTRRAGIVRGSVASSAVHFAGSPVLVARAAPATTAFPERILVASDGSPESAEVAELSARIAAPHHARVTLLHVSGGDSREALHRVAEQAALLYEHLDVEPMIRTEPGRPADRIPRVASAERTSLVITGSRGLRGMRALASVSERVAHDAPCSVLVARPRHARAAEEPLSASASPDGGPPTAVANGTRSPAPRGEPPA